MVCTKMVLVLHIRKKIMDWILILALSCCFLAFPITESSSWLDSGTTSFSPEGRIHQVEYASKAISMARPVIGMVTKEGIALIGIRAISSPLEEVDEPGFGEKVHIIDSHMMVACTGVAADATALVGRCRETAAAHRQRFGEGLPPRRLALRLADTFQAFTHQGGLRPFGAAVLVAGAVPPGPGGAAGPRGGGGGGGAPEEEGEGRRRRPDLRLYAADPTGNFESWKATAFGAGSEKIIKGLEAFYSAERKEQGEEDGQDLAGGIAVGLTEALLKARDLLRELREEEQKFQQDDDDVDDDSIDSRHRKEQQLVIEVGLIKIDEESGRVSSSVLSREDVDSILGNI